MLPPCQLAIATNLCWPRLPNPACRRTNLYSIFGSGKVFSKARFTSTPQWPRDNRQAVQLSPKIRGRLKTINPQLAELVFVFCQNDGAASLLEGLAITFQDCVTSLLGRHAETAGVYNDLHAGGQAHEIVRVGQWVGLVEIIDTPAEAAFRISPSSKTIHMQVADGQNLRCATQFGTKCRPKLSPAVKGSPQKQERTFLHLFMLEAEVRQYHRGTAAHPVVVAYGGLPDISCLVSCRLWEPRAAVLLLAHATYSNVQRMLTLVGEKELFLVGNSREGCTMVPFLRSKRKFRLKHNRFSKGQAQ